MSELLFERIERRFAGQRVIVAATGPSLTPAVAALCRDEIVIAVNDAWQVLPWVAILYACDARWWTTHAGVPEFAGEKWTSHGIRPPNDKRAIAGKYGLHIMAGEMRPGFSRDPAMIHYGRNSGFQAVNLAILMGADPIVLVGFDMRTVAGQRHFFGEHPRGLTHTASYHAFITAFVHASRQAGLPRIVNATPGSALTCFPAVDLATELAMNAKARAA